MLPRRWTAALMPRTVVSVMTSQFWEGRARTMTMAATVRSQKTALRKRNWEFEMYRPETFAMYAGKRNAYSSTM